MIKWALVEETETEAWLNVFDSMSQAIQVSQTWWDHMSKPEKDRRTTFYVGLVNSETCADGTETFSVDASGQVDDKIRLKVWDASGGTHPLTFKKIVKESGLYLSQFCRSYGIPYRTAQNWYEGKPLQDYMISLLAVAVYSNKEV